MQDHSHLISDAIDSLPTELAIFDAEEHLVFANRAFARRCERKPEQILGASLDETLSLLLPSLVSVSGEDLSAAPAGYQHALEHLLRDPGGAHHELEFANGDWRLLHWKATPHGGHTLLLSDVTGLRESLENTRHVNEMVRKLLEACPLPLAMIRLTDLKILYESPANNAMFGETELNKATHAGVYDLIPAERKAYLERLRRDGQVQNFPIHFQRTTGEEFVAALSARLIEFDGEQVIVSGAIDLTDTKAREAELRKARETLTDAIESLSEGFALYDADDRLVMCNSQYRAFNEGSEDLLVPGAYWPDLTRKRAERGLFRDAEGNIDDWVARQLAEREVANNQEFRWAGNRWFEYSHRLTRHGGFVSTWRDITERKAMEESLRKSEAMVRQVLEACPVPISMIRAEDGVIVYENPASRALLKLPAVGVGETVFQRWAEPEERSTYLEQLRTSGAVDGFDVHYRRADGQAFLCAISARLIHYRNEELIVSSLVDLTEARAAEAELASQRERLHQSEKLSALGEVLAGVAHELNNPLSVLLGQAVMLQNETSDASGRRRAERIGEAADRCARIVKTFLSMARHQPIEYQRVDIAQIIDQSLEVTSYALRVAGINVVRHGQQDLPAVYGDAHQLQQVFTNLIVNAQHALEESRSPRRLEIATRFDDTDQQVVVEFIDSGPGIPESIRSRIFEPLFTTKDVDRGTGVGLAVCHRLIEAHKGTIHIEGASDRGAVFVVRLPVAAVSAQPTAAPMESPSISRRYRVLVIDDEPAVAEFLADALEAEGHQTGIALKGSDAVAKLESERFDVILSDVRMPEVDGPSLYQLLAERWPQMASKLGFITGDTLSPRVKTFLQESGRLHLEKPIMPDDLNAFVHRLAQPE